MAFLYKRGDFYYIAFKTRAGVKRISTHKKSKAEANKILINYVPHQVKRKEEIMLSDFQYEFINSITPDHAPGTVDLYRLTFRYALEIMNNKFLDDYGIQDFIKFKNELATRMQLPTVNMHIRNLKCIFNTAFRYEFVSENRAKNLTQFKVEKKKFLAFTADNISDILSSVRESVYRDIILFAIQTGCRLNEVLSLKFKQINYKSGVIEIHSQKTNDFRDVPLTPELEELFKKRIAVYNVIDLDYSEYYVFPNASGNVFDKSKVSKYFKKVLRRLGMDEKFHFHCLRHTFASRLGSSNIPINTIASIMGHKDLETTKIYLHTDLKDKQRGMDVMRIKSN